MKLLDLLSETTSRSKKLDSEKVSTPVGVPNANKETMRNRKMAQEVVKGYRKHIKTSGYNTSYAKTHPKEVNEDSPNETRAEALAKQLPPGLSPEEVLDEAYQILVKNIGAKKAQFYFHHDDDFADDVYSAYKHLHKEKVAEERKDNRAEALARKIPAGLSPKDAIEAAYDILVKDVGERKARYYFYMDEDFKHDVATAYNHFQKNKVTEAFAIKLANGDWYKTERVAGSPLKGGNSQVVEFKSRAAADDFLVAQGNKRGSKKFQDAEIKRAPKLKEETLAEGKFVIKSKDGVEKRFASADSAEAKAWKDSTAKKPTAKVAAYSDLYWERKELDSKDHYFVAPWTRIGNGADDSDAIEKLVNSHHGDAGTTDWTIGRKGEMKRDGTSCATAEINIMFEYGPEDDVGVDDVVSDTETILIARNPQKPKQLDFIKFL